MEDLEGLVLFRVAGATGDAVTTIANIASVSRAFARVARAELWPRYCLARAALAEDGEAAAVAAVAARLVREAASADAPRNAASSLARCMSACPGMEGAAVLMAAGGCGREQEHEDEDEDQPCHVVQEAEVAFESTQKAAVLMAAGGCGDEHEDDDEGKACHVVRGAIAGFKNSRFHRMLQGQAFASSTCPFCHDRAWNATALLKPTAHIALGCNEGDACCFICTQGHLFGLYKSSRMGYSDDEWWDDLSPDERDDILDHMAWSFGRCCR